MTPRAIDKSRWPRLSPLLDELLDLAAADQAGRLADVRRQDAGLADDLAALLALHGELDAERFLDALPLPRPLDLRGQAVGAYRLVSLLGEGGMGSVWRAERADGRYQGQVAIKFMRDGLLGERDARRFLREGQLLARLDHPHIARLLDAGVHPQPGAAAGQGRPYLVLELIDGQPIDAHCEARRLGLRERVRLMQQVCAAVAHAHSRLILHRDLKPSNILVTADGSPKLLDFGIGKLLDSVTDATAPPHTELTRDAGRAYTERYAAPEQLLGEEVTTATDVYALGVLLYGLLGGGHPTEPAKGTLLTRMQAAVEVVPPRLSDAVRRAGSATGQPPRAWRLLQGDLDAVLARALQKAPAERYPHATALADDLRRWLDHDPVTARPDGRAHRLARWLRRHGRVVAVGAAAGVSALSVGLAAALWQAHRAEAQRGKAEQLVAFMLGDLQGKLHQLGRVDLLQSVGRQALDYYGSDGLTSLDDTSLARRAQALRVVAETARLRQDDAQAWQGFAQAADTTGRLLARTPERVDRLLDHAESLNKLQEMAVVHGDSAGGLAIGRQRNALLHQAAARDPTRSELRLKAILSDHDVAYKLARAGQASDALALLGDAGRAADALPAGLPGLPGARTDHAITTGLALVALSRYTEAASAFETGLALLERLPETRDDAELKRQRAMVRRALARARLNAGQLEAAGQAASVIQAELDGAADGPFGDVPLAIEHLNDRLLLAEVLWLRGLTDAARLQLAQVQEQVRRAGPVGPDHLEWHVRTLGNLLAAQTRMAPTATDEETLPIEAMQRLMDRVREAEAAGRPPTGLSLQFALQVGVALGDALQQAGRIEAAEAQWRAVVRRAQPAAERDVAPAGLHLAQAWLRLGQTEPARRWAERLHAGDFRHPDLAALQRALTAPQAAGLVASSRATR